MTKVTKMTKKARLRELSDLTLPLLVEQSFIVLMGMVNTAMVASLGAEALGAAGHINNTVHLAIGLFSAMTTGGTIVVSQAIGARDRSRAASAGGQAVTTTVAFSVLLTALMAIFQYPLINALFSGSDPVMIEAGLVYFVYINISLPVLAITQTFFGVMRGAGDTKSPMKISLFMNIINVILGYLLIIGLQIPFTPINIPSMGMHGAGLALLLARVAGMIYALWAITSKKSVIRLNKLSLYKPTLDIQKAILYLGVPTGIESTMFHAGRTITQMFIVGMGTAAMAANTVASTISGLVMVPGNAIAIGIMVLVGQRVGRREIDDIPNATFFALVVSSVFIGMLCLMLLPFMDILAVGYNLYGQEVIYFRQLMISFLLMAPLFWGVSFLIPSALRAAKDVHYTMISAIITMWLCRIVMGYVLGVLLGWGVLGVWVGMYSDWVARGLLYGIRLKRKRWMKKLVKEQEI